MLMLSGRTGATESYYAVYDNVAGVKFGTPVRVEGYTVGQVAAVDPVTEDERLRFRVELAIAEGFPIPADSTAAIASAGLLSGAAIAIHSGNSATTETLAPGRQIASAPPRSIMTAVSSLAGEVGQLSEEGMGPLLAKLNKSADQLETLLSDQAPVIARDLAVTSGTMSKISRKLDGSLFDQATLGKIETTVANLQQASKTLSQDMLNDTNARRISGTLGNLQRFSKDAIGLTRDLKTTGERVDGLIAELEGFATKNRPELAASIADLRYSLETVARRIDAITYNMETTSRNMHEFARQIRRNPSLLLRGGSPNEAAE